MNKLLKTLLLLILFCGLSFKINNAQIDENKFFIKDFRYRDFSLQKVSDWSNFIGELQLVDYSDYIYIKERQHCSSSEFYYYSILDTANYYSYVYYYEHPYTSAFILVNYDRKGKYIDDVCISSLSGDGGGFYISDGIFINDSTIIRVDETGFNKTIILNPEFEFNKVDENDSIVFTSRKKSTISIKKNGSIQID